MTVVGVTGHRVLADGERIEVGLEKALDRIEEGFSSPLVALSSIAEGADRIVAHAVLAREGGSLRVALPVPPDDYVDDFESDASKEEFRALLRRADEVIELPPEPTRDAAYEAVGIYVLGCCDVLVAIWDGRDAQGRGGTGSIAAEARRRGKPLAWVHAGNRRPGTTEPTTLGDDEGTVTFERFPEAIVT